MPNLIYATTNKGKFSEAQRFFAYHGLHLMSLTEFSVNIDVPETGNTLKENARLKAKAYLSLLPNDSIVISDDTGIEIDALGGEPGIKVRRWKGYNMTDEEIIDHCLYRLGKVAVGQRGAQFRTVLAVAKKGEPIKYFEGTLRGEILPKPKGRRREGMPFWPLFYLPDLKMSLGEFHGKPIDFQLNYPTHREKALLSTLPYLQSIAI